MRKLLALSVAAALALTGSQFALAAPPSATAPSVRSAMHHSWHRGRGWRSAHHREMHRLGRELDLTRAQRQRIRALARASFQQSRPQRIALRQKRAAFALATPGSAGYQAAANDLAHATADLRLAEVLNRSSLRVKIYGLLTPAQRTQLATLTAQRRERIEWIQSHRATTNS